MTVRNANLFHRRKRNPILSAKDWPYPANSVFNPAATLLADGTTLLLCRVEDYRGHSHLCAARSANGIDGWQVDSEPTLYADPKHFPEELWGVEDPRITFLAELDKFAVVYRAGLALFDLERPQICLRRGDEWVFGPTVPYEQQGDVDNVVFPCGYTIAPDGDTLNLYYDAADSTVALATGSIRTILEWLAGPHGASKSPDQVSPRPS